MGATSGDSGLMHAGALTSIFPERFPAPTPQALPSHHPPLPRTVLPTSDKEPPGELEAPVKEKETASPCFPPA